MRIHQLLTSHAGENEIEGGKIWAEARTSQSNTKIITNEITFVFRETLSTS